MPQVVVDLDDGRGPRPAAEAMPNGPNDLPYFVRVAKATAALTEDFDRFVLSYSPAIADQLTARDVWLLIGDESATPVAGDRCPVLRTHGERFAMPSRNLLRDPALAAAERAQWVRNRVRGVWRNRRRFRPRRRHSAPGWLPLGMPAFPNPPDTVPPLEQRPIDVSFRGSIGGGRRCAPKTISRRRLAAAVARLPSDLVVDFVEIESFTAAYTQDPGEYVRSLLDTKICLAPRGGSTETFRVFEGAAAGCAIVTEPLPPAWFYAGLPRVELSSWSQLPAVVGELRSHDSLLELMSREARDWALNVISPEAVGAWAARWLKEYSR